MDLDGELDAREYKLLLDPSEVDGSTVAQKASWLWSERLIPLIEKRVPKRSSGEPRHAGRFDTESLRRECYFDTGAGDLARRDLSVRSRFQLSGKSEGEWKLTLKLRTADLLRALAAREQTDSDAKDKLEEDIAPLGFTIGTIGRDSEARFSPKPGIWTRFSLSSTAKKPAPPTYGALAKLFGRLDHGEIPARTELVPGPPVEEAVWSGAEVHLAKGVRAEFSFTYWQIGKPSPVPTVAEISYRVDLDEKPAESGLDRAQQLFLAMQEDLQPLVEKRFTSKTALVIPRATGAP